MEDILIVPTSKPDQRVITWDQAHQLLEVPNLERRVRRDLQDTLHVAYYHKDKSRLRFVLHNDRERAESGRSCVELLIDNQ